MMRRPLASGALLGLLLLGGPTLFAVPATTLAAAQNESMLQLQELETVSYRAATAFYLYNVLNRDPQEFRKMQAQLVRGDALASTIENGDLQAPWNALKKSCTSARFTNEGVADNDSVIAVDGALNELTRNVRNRMSDKKAAGKLATDKMADMLYDQYVLMEVMTAAYLRRSADYFGGAIVASQGPQVEIDKLADKFSSQLKQLNVHYAKNPKVAPLLREVTTKWGFVRKSFINFNEDNVAFVVGRYNAQITEKLLAAHASTM